MKHPTRLMLIGNLLIAFAVLVLEKFAIGAHIYEMVKETNTSFLSGLLYDYGKSVSRILVLSAIIFAILIQRQLNQYRKAYIDSYHSTTFYYLVGQVVCFALFYNCSDLAFRASGNQVLYQFVWLILGVSLAVLTFASLASLSFWKILLVEQRWNLMIALVISSSVWWLSSATQNLWGYFGDLTFFLVASCLSWLSDGVYLDYGNRIIGFREFYVNIDTQCSGYEGIGLVTAFVSIFLYSFREDFRFPRSLILFPIGALVIWVFNILRIIILILIGSYWSKDVAVWGFHTQAGWITFILTSVGLMWLAHNIAFFSKYKKPEKESTGDSINLPIATLLPLIALLASTFITKALSGQIDWLYPVRVVVVAFVIIRCVKYLDLFPLKCSYRSLAAGLLVALIWLVLVDIDSTQDGIYQSAFLETNNMLVGFWLLFRFMGAVITVPIAEELGFRAYLLCSLSSKAVITRGSIPFSFFSFVVSSAAFGLLHGAWLAGTLAGLVYALVRYRSEHIMDAIVAHGVTNFLLFCFILYTGHWSLL